MIDSLFTSWGCTGFANVIEQNRLTVGVIYLMVMEVRFDKAGTDTITQSVLVPITNSSSSSGGTPNDLYYTVSALGVGTANAYFVRLRVKNQPYIVLLLD